MLNKIALFTATPRSPTALLIAAATNCPISHAAIQVDGTWYHASETAGRFCKVEINQFAKRHVVIYEFHGDLEDWLMQMMGTEYDWQGIRGWAMKCVGFNQFTTGNPKAFYCFEAALAAIIQARRKQLGSLNAATKLDGRLITFLQMRGCAEVKDNVLSLSGYLDYPVSGCDIASLFHNGRFGKFGGLA